METGHAEEITEEIDESGLSAIALDRKMITAYCDSNISSW